MAKPGELTCILGPSGAGKSTLLSVLGKRLSADQSVGSCDVLMNEKPYDQEMFKQVGAYLEQDDVLWQGSTPRELFTFVSKIKMPDLTTTNREFAIDKLVSILGLKECQHTPIGG